jgi:hypothetical protein
LIFDNTPCSGSAEQVFGRHVSLVSVGGVCSPPTKEKIMKNRNLALGSVASFAIAGTLIAAPCSAQSLPRTSTPQEQAQTEILNAQQASEPAYIVSPSAPVERASNADAIAAYNASVAAANAEAQARYQTQLKDYREKSEVYQAQRDDYRQDLDAYQNPPPDVVEEHHIILDSPAVVTVEPDERAALDFPDRDRSLVSLHDIDRPDSELAGVPVEDRAGHLVGHFAYVTSQDGGEEKAVITLRNNKKIVLDDDHLRFDTDHDTVVADLTFDELNSMPARF